MSQRETYLFIDAEYLKQRYRHYMQSYFGASDHAELIEEMELETIKSQANAQKAFYYDCLHDIRRNSETDEAFQERLERDTRRLERIRRLDGFHVRLGSVSGDRKKIRQKQVDVLLAVDMLSHAHRGNFRKAILLAGDLDFKPVIDALVQAGSYVTLWCDRIVATNELRSSADSVRDLAFSDYIDWTDGEFLAFTENFPWKVDAGKEDLLPHLMTGHTDRIRIELHGGTSGDQGDAQYIALCDGDRHSIYVAYEYPDRSRLQRFVELEYGPVQWKGHE
jgi:uncharacterized LabA/DUF88 family protein